MELAEESGINNEMLNLGQGHFSNISEIGPISPKNRDRVTPFSNPCQRNIKDRHNTVRHGICVLEST